MNEKKQIWTENYKISSYLVNMKNRAGLYSILNLVQDVGWLHGIHLEVQLPKNQNWVFTRQKLVMEQWPVWNEIVTIRTWLRPPLGAFLLRDYEILIGDRKIGECTSTFGIMDLLTRKIVVSDWQNFPNVWRHEEHVNQTPSKIILTNPMTDLAQFPVRNSDLDMNNHVNNTKYAQWILDAVPLDPIKNELAIRVYEVNFLAEAKAGELVKIQRTPTVTSVPPLALTQFQGIRSFDGKPLFAAEIQVSQAN